MNVGRIAEIFRFPVKSMAGMPTDTIELGWHGLDGDRRFAFRRAADRSGFPWLTASRLPELVRYSPFKLDGSAEDGLPTHVRTPAGRELELESPELRAELAERFGGEVDLLRMHGGIFDEAPVSLISLATVAGIGREAGLDLDHRRFRANLVIETDRPEPFLEDGWVGRTVKFGDGDPGPAVSVMLCDARCRMINLDPDTAAPETGVLKTVGRLNQGNAGVYATVVRTGTIRVGDRVTLA